MHRIGRGLITGRISPRVLKGTHSIVQSTVVDLLPLLSERRRLLSLTHHVEGADKKSKRAAIAAGPGDVLLISATGEKAVMVLSDAQRKAAELKMALVLVAANANPPVYKLVLESELREKANAARAKEAKEAAARAALIRQRREQAKADAKITKELRIQAGIQNHDLQIKLNRAREFLSKGLFVKFSIAPQKGKRFNAEEQSAVMDSIVDQLSDVARPAGEAERRFNKNTIILEQKRK